jgi:hypothetical protein
VPETIVIDCVTCCAAQASLQGPAHSQKTGALDSSYPRSLRQSHPQCMPQKPALLLKAALAVADHSRHPPVKNRQERRAHNLRLQGHDSPSSWPEEVFIHLIHRIEDSRKSQRP